MKSRYQIIKREDRKERSETRRKMNRLRKLVPGIVDVWTGYDDCYCIYITTDRNYNRVEYRYDIGLVDLSCLLEDLIEVWIF